MVSNWFNIITIGDFLVNLISKSAFQQSAFTKELATKCLFFGLTLKKLWPIQQCTLFTCHKNAVKVQAKSSKYARSGTAIIRKTKDAAWCNKIVLAI